MYLDTYKCSMETPRWTRGGTCVVDSSVSHRWAASTGCAEHHLLEGTSICWTAEGALSHTGLLASNKQSISLENSLPHKSTFILTNNAVCFKVGFFKRNRPPCDDDDDDMQKLRGEPNETSWWDITHLESFFFFFFVLILFYFSVIAWNMYYGYRGANISFLNNPAFWDILNLVSYAH